MLMVIIKFLQNRVIQIPGKADQQDKISACDMWLEPIEKYIVSKTFEQFV